MNDDGSRLGALGLELVAQAVDEVAHRHQALAAALRPERVRDLLGVHHAVALADEVLEHVPGSLLEPGAAQVALLRLHPRAAEHRDVELGPRDPERVAAAAAVLRVAGPQVEHRPPLLERRGRHPQRGHLAGHRGVDPDLGQRLALLGGEVGEAAVLAGAAGLAAVEQLVAAG